MEKDKFEVNWEAVKKITDHRISKKERDIAIDFSAKRAASDLKSAKEKNDLANFGILAESIFVGSKLLLVYMGNDLTKLSISLPTILSTFVLGLFVKMKIEAKEDMDYYKKEKRYFEQLKTIYADYKYDDECIDDSFDKGKTLKLNKDYEGRLYGENKK